MTLQVSLLNDGSRLHLQHGPIDLIIGADGDRKAAFKAATERFETVLSELVEELPALRTPFTSETTLPSGAVARRMHIACQPFRRGPFVTRMAAVAGSVADEILAAMTRAARLSRAYVNNGGDIAVHLEDGDRFDLAMARHDGADLGRIALTAGQPSRGVATSGRHGRSLSLGIADSVTVLARTAAAADVAATLVANAVDLPGHPAIDRTDVAEIDDQSDISGQSVPTLNRPLSPAEEERALRHGLRFAEKLRQDGVIDGAALTLGQLTLTTDRIPQISLKRMHEYA